MNDSNIYVKLWQKYKPAIVSKMKLAVNEKQSYQLTKHEFTVIGDSISAGYRFHLEFKNGRVCNNIEGSSPARCLVIVINESDAAKEIMKDKHYIIKLDTKFVLHISVK